MRLWVVLALLVFDLFGEAINEKNKEGAELYEAGRLDEALAAFSQAQIDSPDAAEIHYNIGNVHYRKKETEKALQEYRAALGGDREVQRRARFNMGNVHYRANDLEAAVREYKQALKIDPDDLEARQNLELALRRQEQKKQQQEQESGGGGGGQKSEDKKEKSQPSGSQNQPRPESQPQPQPRQENRSEGGKMSKQDAERILSALAEMEKAEQRRQQQNQPARSKARGKDW